MVCVLSQLKPGADLDRVDVSVLKSIKLQGLRLKNWQIN